MTIDHGLFKPTPVCAGPSPRGSGDAREVLLVDSSSAHQRLPCCILKTHSLISYMTPFFSYASRLLEILASLKSAMDSVAKPLTVGNSGSKRAIETVEFDDSQTSPARKKQKEIPNNKKIKKEPQSMRDKSQDSASTIDNEECEFGSNIEAYEDFPVDRHADGLWWQDEQIQALKEAHKQDKNSMEQAFSCEREAIKATYAEETQEMKNAHAAAITDFEELLRREKSNTKFLRRRLILSQLVCQLRGLSVVTLNNRLDQQKLLFTALEEEANEEKSKVIELGRKVSEEKQVVAKVTQQLSQKGKEVTLLEKQLSEAQVTVTGLQEATAERQQHKGLQEKIILGLEAQVGLEKLKAQTRGEVVLHADCRMMLRMQENIIRGLEATVELERLKHET
jgi:hypothetical protein